jgi:hypothetical protein
VWGGGDPGKWNARQNRRLVGGRTEPYPVGAAASVMGTREMRWGGCDERDVVDGCREAPGSVCLGAEGAFSTTRLRSSSAMEPSARFQPRPLSADRARQYSTRVENEDE